MYVIISFSFTFIFDSVFSSLMFFNNASPLKQSLSFFDAQSLHQ